GAYLNQTCVGDTALRQRVEELLRASEDAEEFLEEPAPGAQRPEALQLVHRGGTSAKRISTSRYAGWLTATVPAHKAISVLLSPPKCFNTTATTGAAPSWRAWNGIRSGRSGSSPRDKDMA